MERANAWKTYSEQDMGKINSLCDDYKAFISFNKTERECVASMTALAESCGYVPLELAIEEGQSLQSGDAVWASKHGKTLMLVHIGEEPMVNGFNILGAHIDSPRLDLKQNPLYESNGLVLLDTHYYGGIKHYQWVTIPLALHGVVAKKDGTVVQVAIGDQADDPVFCVTDLLIHLGKAQLEKKGSEVVEGEALDVLAGGQPLPGAADDCKEPVREQVLAILKEKYGIEEEDFLSAELEVVPAGEARDLGFDRSMVIGYGQDDRVCAYTSFAAQLEVVTPKKTTVCILVDKEEIGSVGATGMASLFFEDTIAEIMELAGEGGALNVHRALAASSMLSSDVSAGFDPSYANVFETKNAAYLGRGLVFNKYTGARGKSGSNDARAEYVARVRSIMDDAEVHFQTAELGKVDAGGGGTIAYIPAKYGMDVIDSGVAVLSMHAPWEVTSKADIYEAFKGYKAFLLNA
ncbi:MAG: aminopeptidase [Eggerthellaceae bacterium]|nr:aminopeptidase [Eggerthellaceae bacterium]